MPSRPIVGTGDSILGQTLGIVSPGGEILNVGEWVDCEYGRGPLAVGLQGRESTTSIWPDILASSQVGGWIIVQDNGLGASQAQWETMIGDILTDTPNDRGLTFVLPAYDPAFNAALHATVRSFARAMVNLARELRPATALIEWNTKVLCGSAADPFTTDGQHPSARGITWLSSRISQITGL